MKSLLLITTLLCCVATGWSSNILAIFAMPSYSHYTLGHRLLEELAIKGHDVTMIAPYRQDRKIPNYTEIYLDGLADIIGDMKTVFFDMEAMLPINQIILCYHLGYAFSNFTLKYQPVIDLVNSKKTFDVVIIDQFLNEALLAIPYKLNAPVVYLSSMMSSVWSNHLVANAAPLSQIPNIFLDYNGKMNFFQRIHNLLLYIGEELYRILIAYPIHEQLVQETFPGLPNLNTLIYNRSSFILVNSHISINDPMPHVPNMVEIGGFHPKKQELPPDLKEYLDNSKNGVIFFGMGSNLKVALLPVDKRDAILKSLGKLKEDVLWKWEEDSLPGQPANVKTRKWLPQQAILAHPNTKAFISHGGLLSTIEAVYFGVPILGIPIYGDQKMNIHLAVNRGYALSLPFSELTEGKLTNALNEILSNNTYRQTVKARSVLMKERPIDPLQEAVFWVEHVIKYKGSEHFRNSAMDLKWYQYEMLDVAAFLLLVGVLISISIYLVIKRLFCFRSFAKQKNQNHIDKKKKIF